MRKTTKSLNKGRMRRAHFQVCLTFDSVKSDFRTGFPIALISSPARESVAHGEQNANFHDVLCLVFN